MTCIVGVKHEGKVFMAGDGRLLDMGDIIFRSEPKVYINGPLIIGGAGENRVLQLVQVTPAPPGVPMREFDVRHYLITTYIPTLIKAFTDSGVDITRRRDDGEYLYEFALMVGMRGQLFTIDEDLGVTEFEDFAAIGSGAAWAQGSMRRTAKRGPKQRLKLALDDASAFCSSVGPPYTFLSL